MCSCGACYVDGGTDYVHIGGDSENIELLTEYGDIPGYYITYYSMFGSQYTTSTTKNINDIIRLYEDGGNYVIVEDEQHNEIYRTPGIDRVIKANKSRTTPVISNVDEKLI